MLLPKCVKVFDRYSLNRFSDGFKGHIESGNGSFVVLFDQNGSDETYNGFPDGEYANDISSPADLPIEPFLWVVRPYLPPMALGKGG